MRRKLGSFLESLVVAMIILVIIQTFLEDFFILAGLSWNIRKYMVAAAVCFDLFFTIEFLVRLFAAMNRKHAAYYFFKERGWVDFAASVPLLLFSSGPAAVALLTGASSILGGFGVLNVLKVVKAIRIARVLRLLRILKIFRQIKYTQSVTAQRQISMITTITISSVVAIILLSNIISGVSGIPGSGDVIEEYHRRSADMISHSKFPLLRDYTGAYDDLLILKKNGETVYSAYDNRFYSREFGPMDYLYIQEGEAGFFYDLRDLNRIQAKDNLTYFFIIIVITLAILFYYSPYFAMTITDPIHVISRGLLEKNYNNEVKTTHLPDGDVRTLAKAYNEKFLPLKSRQSGNTDMESDILVENIDDLFKEL